MFTGLVEGRGTVLRLENKGEGLRPWIKAEFAWPDPRLGESIAVNGVCLTATAWKDGVFAVDVSEESLSRSTLGRLQAGKGVNLERALRLSDRLGGHLVTGHVDGVGGSPKEKPGGSFYGIGSPFRKIGTFYRRKRVHCCGRGQFNGEPGFRIHL